MRQVNSDHAYYFMIIIIYFVCVHTPIFQVSVIFYANVLTCKRKSKGNFNFRNCPQPFGQLTSDV